MKGNNGITDVFFDLDHTLWDFEKNSALTFNKIFKLNNVEVNLNDFLEQYIPINFKYWKLYREEKIKKEDLRFARLNETFQGLNISMELEVIHQISEDYIKYLSTFNYVIKDAIHVLEYLKPKYKLHIITNGYDKVQYEKMDNSNIIHYFNTITNSEIAGVKKPNPKIFEFALRQANVRAKNSIMIGDSLEADVEGALNIGMDAIFYNPKPSEISASVKKISSLIQLKQLL
ncbi:YjjG family noncanonical pyrimidine nucleotidase [Algibacter sp. 2305UL17-15]|uniref:YjjG family noncanonical pyrimidine nucleotidase n=1 Tax=Algibacter sp. 2305UL17-15 TaxID=3231268 RepID=UPI00345B2712